MSSETSARNTDSSGSEYNSKYPDGAGVILAARDDSSRFYFRNPAGGISSIPAMNAEQARDILADRVRGFGPEDFEEVDGFDAEPWPYPDPATSDREVNEHDLWMLRVGMTVSKHRKKLNAYRNPTERMIRLLLEEWSDPSEIPLRDPEGLQQADGIGPDSAARIVGAAVSTNLISRPVR